MSEKDFEEITEVGSLDFCNFASRTALRAHKKAQGREGQKTGILRAKEKDKKIRPPKEQDSKTF